jgi:hypothetical protein
MWRRSAAHERSLRLTGGWLSVSLSVAELGLGVAALAVQGSTPLAEGVRVAGMGGGSLGFAALFGAFGVVGLSTEGQMESRLHAYDSASLHTLGVGARF